MGCETNMQDNAHRESIYGRGQNADNSAYHRCVGYLGLIIPKLAYKACVEFSKIYAHEISSDYYPLKFT